MNKTTKGLFVVLISTVLLFSVLSTTAFATSTNDSGTTSTNNKNVIKVKAASTQITWNANGGKFATKKTKTTSIKKGTKIKKFPTSPKRTNYAIKGWYTKKSGGTKITTNTIPTKKVTYYAQWLKKYTLTFDPNGGKVTTKTKKVAKTKVIGTLPKPTKTGYTFTGWYTTKTGTKKISTTTKMPAQNLKVYAHWKKGNSTTNPNRELTAAEKKLVGSWSMYNSVIQVKSPNGQNFVGPQGDGIVYNFLSDGTYYLVNSIKTSYSWTTYHSMGKWAANNGIITLSNRQSITRDNDGNRWVGSWREVPGTSKFYYTIPTENGTPYFIRELEPLESPIDISMHVLYKKIV